MKKKRIWVKHIIKEGPHRFHVLSGDSKGTHCSEPDCEINKPHSEVKP